MPNSKYAFDALLGVGRVELSFQENQRVYVLFGSNGVGKTKCLEALFQYFLLGCELFTGDTYWTMRGRYGVAQRYIGDDNEFFIPRGPVGILAGSSLGAIKPVQKHALPVVFLGAGQRGHIQNHSPQSEPIGTFEDRRRRYFNSIVDGMNADFSNLGMQAGLEQWFVTLAQSANPYQKGGDNRKVEIDTLLRLLNEVDSRYDPNFMQIDGANRVSLKIDGQVTELRHLSTGFTSLLKMLQAIITGYANFTNEVNLAHVKGIVFIDEIESHLHVEWQSKIVLMLKKLFPNTTFFIATHSPLVLTQLEEGEAYQLRRDEGDGVVRSHLITAPNKQALIDVLREGFEVDVNALKRERMSPESQEAAKKRLLALINDSGAAV